MGKPRCWMCKRCTALEIPAKTQSALTVPLCPQCAQKNGEMVERAKDVTEK